MAVIETEQLSKRFGDFWAIRELDFTLREGQIKSVIGPNGAGKTTFFDLLTGTLEPTGGSVYFRGEEMTGESPYDIARRGIARSFQVSNLFEGLSVKESLKLGALATTDDRTSPRFALSKMAAREDLDEAARQIAEKVDLGGELEKPPDELAHGQKRKLEVGLTLSTGADTLLFDEPAAGLTTEETKELMDLIQSISAGKTILLIEHDIEFVLEISDRIAVLHQGELLSEGTPEEVRADDAVQEVYLGGQHA